MIGHLNHEQQKNANSLFKDDSLLQEESLYGSLLQDQSVNMKQDEHKKDEKKSNLENKREQLYEDYVSAVHAYKDAQKKNLEREGSVPKAEVEKGITFDDAREYLLFFMEFDIYTDEALINNYSAIKDIENMLNKMKSIPDFMNSCFLEPEMKNKYDRLCIFTEYAQCRLFCFNNILFTMLSEEDMQFIENAPDLEAVLERRILDKIGDDLANSNDLENLFKDIKRAKELKEKLKEKVNDKNPFFDDTDDFLNAKFDEEMDTSFIDGQEDINKKLDELDLDDLENKVQQQKQQELQEQQEQQEQEQKQQQENRKVVSSAKDREYVAQHFPYSELLNNKRKNDVEDGPEMKDIKFWIQGLYKIAVTDTWDPATLDEVYGELINKLEKYVSTHDVFYKAFTDEGSTRLRLVKDALTRARLEQERLHKLCPVLDESDVKKMMDGDFSGSSKDIFPQLVMGADIAMAVRDKGKKICESKNRISLLAEMFYHANTLSEDNPERYSLLGGSDGVAAQLLEGAADKAMLRDFYAEKDRMIIRLFSVYNEYRRHPVPKAFLQDKNADPGNSELKDNYALLRIMHDDAYRKLVGMNMMEQQLRKKNGGVLDEYLARRQRGYKKNEQDLRQKGENLFEYLTDLASVHIQNLAGHFPGIDAGQVTLMHYEETNESKKAMKKYGLEAEKTGEETLSGIRDEFAQKYPQYADTQRYDHTTGSVFEEETRMKKGDERTNRRYARSGIAPGSAMKKRSLMTGVMANLLGMGNLVAQDTYGVKQVDGKAVQGVYKQAPLGISLVENSAYEMDANAKAQMAKLVFLNIICGQMDLDSAMLTGEKKVLSNGSNAYIIKNIRLEKYTEFSFGTLSGQELIDAYKKGRHAKLLGKLDEATKKAIRDLNPLFLEQQFGAYLSKEEMAALKDRVSAVQSFLDKLAAVESVKKDTYEPEREYVPKGEELSFSKVMDYAALPESERAKRRSENITAYSSISEALSLSGVAAAKRFRQRLSEETGLTPKQIQDITAGDIGFGELRIRDGMNGNRTFSAVMALLSQDMATDEDVYLIIKGLYAEKFAPYTHQDKEDARASFDLAVSKYKDLALKSFERLIEKFGEMPALLNPDDIMAMVDSAEMKAMMRYCQDMAIMHDNVQGGSLFDENDPRDARLVDLLGYVDAFNQLWLDYKSNSENYEQDFDLMEGAFDPQFKPGAVKDITSETPRLKDQMKIILNVARKLHKGPALSQEEYDIYTADCQERFKKRPLARKYEEKRKEILKDHSFVKKEKTLSDDQDDSDYEARVEELRGRKNTSVTVEGLKLRDEYLKEDINKLREINEFMAEHNIEINDYQKAFDVRSPRIFLQSYERDEYGKPKDKMAKKIHEQNRDFLSALFTGDRDRMRPHLDRAIAKVLSYDISIEHLKDKNWMIKHPEMFHYIMYYTYLNDCILKNEEYAWYFDEMSPKVSAFIMSRAAYITELSKIIMSSYFNGALGFKSDSSDMKLYTDLNAEGNCMTEEAAWEAYQRDLNELLEGNDSWLTDYHEIKFLPLYKKQNAKETHWVMYAKKVRAERQEIKNQENRPDNLNKFYKKYENAFPKKEAAGPGDSVALLHNQNWSRRIKNATASGADVKLEAVKSSMGKREHRSDTRISMLLEDREQKKKFDEVCALLKDEIHEIAGDELKFFYSFYLSNLAHQNSKTAAGNLESVIRNYYKDAAGRQKAMDAMTLDLIRVAQDKSAFGDKMLKGLKGFAMQNMAKDYTALLRKNPEYVSFLKNKKDPYTGRSYADMVGDALDIIRACGQYTRIYNLLAMDPVYASCDSAFLTAPATKYDTAHIGMLKATMVILDNLAVSVSSGQYKKIKIDDIDALEQENKRIDDFCARFSEPAGIESEAIQEITHGLKTKTEAMETADKKVLELSRLLSSLSTMQDSLRWEEHVELEAEIGKIISENPEKLKEAAVNLRTELYKSLDADYKRFISGEIPEYLKDPGYKGDVQEQKKSAALLMLTTTMPYRRIRGVEKLLKIMGNYVPHNADIAAVFDEAYEKAGSDSYDVYPGLSQKGIIEVKDMAKRVNLRSAKANLAVYTASGNVGYVERKPITKEEIDNWFKILPGQEENSKNKKPVKVDKSLLKKAGEKLSGIHEEFSESITAEGVIFLEHKKKDTDNEREASEKFKGKMLKDPDNTYGIDVRDHFFYDVGYDGSSMEILWSEEPEVREIYMDKFVRKMMDLEISPEKMSVNWALDHLNEMNYIMNMGVYTQNILKDNPEYFNKFPKSFHDLFIAKADMVMCFTNCIKNELTKIGISFGQEQYITAEEGYDNPDNREMFDSEAYDVLREYYNARHKMLWICRNAGNGQVQGEEKYTLLSKDVNTAAYKNKPLTGNDYKKPDKAAMKQRRSKNTLNELDRSLSSAQNEIRRLKEEATRLIPSELADFLTVNEVEVLCCLYPLIVASYHELDADFAREEFKSLCRLMAGVQDGRVSPEVAALQKKAFRDIIGEYIMSYKIIDPALVQTDENMTLPRNVTKLEVLSEAITAFRKVINDNPDWMNEKNNRITQGGRSEGELIRGNMKVLEALVKDYNDRKQAIRRAKNGNQ